MTTMECSKCATSGFNRLIIEVQSGDIVGSLCEDCEPQHHLRDDEAPPTGEAGTCHHCRQRARIALPRLECEIEYEDKLLVEYDRAAPAPHLCDDCAPVPLVDVEPTTISVSDSAL